MKVLMHALAASCEELHARTGNPPLIPVVTSSKLLSSKMADISLLQVKIQENQTKRTKNKRTIQEMKNQ
jgi:hypothetical protein